MAHGRDSRLALERVQKYLGTADVKLSQLTEFYDCEPTLQPDSHRVEVLERKLRQSSVKDGVQEHHLRAVVSVQSLDRALQAEQLSRATFLERSHDPTDFPKLDFAHGGLTCLGGQSRVLAARNIPPWDRRWPVDLYHEDISSGLRMQLRDKLNIQAPLSDGEIFLTYQQLKRAGNVSSMSQWGAYLSENKEKNLHRVANTEWGMILNSLSQIPGLWQVDDFIGKLHKMQSLHVNSEYVHYLKEIEKCFGEPFGENPALMARFTTGDICALQGATSGPILDQLIHKGDLLKAFSGSEQERFYEYIRSRPYMIPTVFTFFQDDNLISQCAPMVLKLIDRTKLVPDNGLREPDIKASMRYMFERESGTPFSDRFEIQVSESRSRTVTADSHLRFELAYRQLWLYTIRHFLRPDHRKHRKIRFYVDEESEIRLLAVFALTLRFSSDSITILTSREATASRSRVILDETSGTRCAESSQKYGIPHPASWQWDRQLLYLDRIYSTPDKTDGITTFFVLQSVFYNFFGYPDGFTPVNSIPEPENSVPPTSPADNTSERTARNPPPFTGEHTSQNSTPQANNGGRATYTGLAQGNVPSFTDQHTSQNPTTPGNTDRRTTGHTQNNPPPLTGDFQHFSTSFVDLDLGGDQETINKIDEILANLTQYQTKTESLRSIMPQTLEAIPWAKREMNNFQESHMSLPAEQKIPENPDIWLEYMAKSLKQRIKGLDYARSAGLELTKQLGGIKQRLQQSPLTPGLALAQAVDIEFNRYNYLSCQVEDDLSFAKQVFSALVLAAYLKEFGSIQTVDKNMADIYIKRQNIEHIIEIARIDGDWTAGVREIGTIWDADFESWKAVKARAPVSWTSLDSLDASSCQDLLAKHNEWMTTYNSNYEAFTNHFERYDSLMAAGVNEAMENLGKWLNQLEQNLAVLVMDETTKDKIQLELTDIKGLKKSEDTWNDLLKCRDRLQKVDDFLNLNRHDSKISGMNNTVNLEQNIPDLQMPSGSSSTHNPQPETGQLLAHVNFVRNIFVLPQMEIPSWYEEAQLRYSKALASYQNALQIDGHALQEQAIEMENAIYQLIRGDIRQKADTFKDSSKLTKDYNNFKAWARERHERVSEDIHKDPSRGTAEYKDIQKGRDMFLKLFDYKPRRSSRLLERVKLWILIEGGDCRPLLVNIYGQELSRLEKQFRKAEFELQLLRDSVFAIERVPISFVSKEGRSCLKNKDTVGLLAFCQKPLHWKNAYGTYLKNSEIFTTVTWTESFHWDQVGAAKDFDLAELSRTFL